LNGSDTTGDIIGGVTGVGVAALAASPIIDAAVAHLGSLTKIIQVAKQLGLASFGMKEAHDLYKMVSGKQQIGKGAENNSTFKTERLEQIGHALLLHVKVDQYCSVFQITNDYTF
jgi:hypothetical protein